MKKRLISWLTACCMALTLLPTPVLAAGSDPGQNQSGTPVSQEGESSEPTEGYEGITLRYGDGKILEVALPEDSAHYTYGTSSEDGTEITVTAANSDFLPRTGWNWAVQRVTNSYDDSWNTSGRPLYSAFTGPGYALRMQDFHLTNNGSGAAIESQVPLYVDLVGDSTVTAAAEDSAAILANGKPVHFSSIFDNSRRYSSAGGNEVGIGTLTAKGGAYGVQSTNGDADNRTDISVGESATVTAIGAQAGVMASGTVQVYGVLSAEGTGAESYGIKAQKLRYAASVAAYPLYLTAKGGKSGVSVEKLANTHLSYYTGKVGADADNLEDWDKDWEKEDPLGEYAYVQFVGNGVKWVSTFDELKAALTQKSPSVRRIYVTKDITIPSKLTVRYPVSIVGVGKKAPVLSRGSGYTSALFQIGSGNEWTGHVRMQNLVIDGKNIKATGPAIYMEKMISNSDRSALGLGTLVLGGKVEIKNCVNKGYKLDNSGKTKVYSTTDTQGNGGAIYITYNAHVNLLPGSKITNCTAYNGGAVHGKYQWEAWGATFSNNTAADLKTDVNSSTYGSTNYGYGGACYGGTLHHCTVSNNTAAESGGGTYGSSLYEGCVVENNEASLYGGGVCRYNDDITVSDSIIRNNKVSDASDATYGYGGGIYSAKTVTNCVITGNEAAVRGGGLYVQNGTVTGCTISGNTSAYGGGVYAYYVSSTFTDSTLSYNQATETGGGLYSDAMSKVTNCTFANNSAKSGGGIYGLVDMTGGKLTGNTAEENGGGLQVGYAYQKEECVLTGTEISGNTAKNGGGIYSGTNYYSVGTLTLDNVRVWKNTASVKGGGLYAPLNRTYNSFYHYALKDALFYENKAETNGGGVYLEKGKGTFTVSGTTDIQDNVCSGNGTENNLYMETGSVLTIGRDEVVDEKDGTVTAEELPGLTRGAGIWISPESYPELGAQSVIANYGLTTDSSEFADNYSVFFHTDADKYECVTVKTTTGEGDDAVTTRKVVLQRQTISLDKPEGKKLPYNGAAQSGVAENDGYVLTGDTEKTEVGDYEATATLNSGYKWSDDSGDASVDVKWSIVKKVPEAGDFLFKAPHNLVYNGYTKPAAVALSEPYTGGGEITVKYFNEEGQRVTPINAGTYTVKISMTEGDNFEAVSNLIIDTFTILQGNGPEAPACDFSFDGENGGKLVGSTDKMEYSLDGGKSWTDCTTDTVLPVDPITSASGIQVRVKETKNNRAGAVQVIEIKENGNIPAAVEEDCLSKGNTGKLTNVDNTMEYSVDGKNWIAITGETVENLAADTYKVRYRAAGKALPSKAQELTIKAYVSSTEKKILTFEIDGAEGVIDETNHTVTVTVPYGTSVTALKPVITISAKATIDPADGQVQDFGHPVTYTVTAEDDSTQAYTVTVIVADPAILSVTAPGEQTLEEFAETADAAISELPATVAITSESGVTELPCGWTLVGASFDRTPNATNTFRWKADTTGFTVNGQTVEGTVSIRNRAPIPLSVRSQPVFDTEKTYDGNADVTQPVLAGEAIGLLEGDVGKVFVTVADAFYDSKNAGERTITIVYKVEDGVDSDSAWKYQAPEDGKVSGKINPAEIEVVSAHVAASKKYDSTTRTEVLSVTFAGLMYNESLTAEDYIAVANYEDAEVGTDKNGTVTVKMSDTVNARNYVLKNDGCEFVGDIVRGDGGSLGSESTSLRYTDRKGHTYAMSQAALPGGQDWTFSISEVVTTGCAALAQSEINEKTGELSYALVDGEAEDTVTWTITASCDNYEDYTGTVTLILSAREEQADFKFLTGDLTMTYGDPTFTLQVSGAAEGSAVSFKSSDETVATVDPVTGEVTILKVGQTTITATASATDDYMEGKAAYVLTVDPKTLTITAGSSSAYAGSVLPKMPGYTVDGLVDGDDLISGPILKYVDAEGNEITPDMTKPDVIVIRISDAEASENYDIKFKDGTLTISRRPSAGGSGGHRRPV